MIELNVIHLPVYLPGSNRDWTKVDGIATINEDGVITIQLQHPKNAERLVQMAKDGILMQLSFDYKMSMTTVDKINRKYKQE